MAGDVTQDQGAVVAPNEVSAAQAQDQAVSALPASAPPTPPAALQQPAAPPSSGSRLGAILGAVARTVDTGLAGVPAGRRPSFIGGLGEGARAQQAEEQRQQAIKFKTFDDQVRLAELHNQDVKLQQDTQAQRDAHIKADLDNRALANSLGIDYDQMVNHGPTVTDHMTAQSATGGVSVQPGTHISGDGEFINIPKDTQQTRDGQKQMYNMLGPSLGLPPLPPGAQFVPPKQMNMLTNKLHGFGVNGEALKHEELPGMIGAEQKQRDNLAKNGATPDQLTALDNMIAIHQANLDALDKHASDLEGQKKQTDIDVETNPANVKAEASKTSAIEAAKLPFDLAKKRAEQALKDGDPNAAGQMLANGDIAPSQLFSTRNPEFIQKAMLAAKQVDPNFNGATAETHFKAANSPTNLGFFGSAKSLTDPGGTLQQLEEAYKKLPNGQIPKFNKLADWQAAARGTGVVAGFAQTALGVADDYAKVMGGGQGSDSAREEMLKGFSMASSPKDMEASIEAARMAVGSQMQSRIGDNKFLSRAYGSNMPQKTMYANAPGKPRMMSRDGGKSWQPALAQ